MRFYNLFKRIGEATISFILIIFLSPLFMILAVWVKLTSKGPIIYKHTRIGKDRKPFNIYKFRSMVVGARKLQEKGYLDERLITPTGNIMRKTYLDEIPQLFNVLKGDMSFIGPRPFDKEYFNKSPFIKRYPKVREIVKIKPGMTSLHSIADYLPVDKRIRFEKKFKGLFKKDIYIETLSKYNVSSKKYMHVPEHHKYVLDSYYIEHESFMLDIKLIYYTFLLMLKKINEQAKRKIFKK